MRYHTKHVAALFLTAGALALAGCMGVTDPTGTTCRRSRDAPPLRPLPSRALASASGQC
jgi:hypothetical protein